MEKQLQQKKYVNSKNEICEYRLPLVSIVMPCYNDEKYIKETIQSVIDQTYHRWELLIVDDRSIDNTVTIVREICKVDKRIKLHILPEKGGASIARNYAISLATGKYVAFLDSDDKWLRSKLEVQVNFMEKKGSLFSYHHYELIDNSSKRMGIVRSSPKKMSYSRMIFGSSIGCLSVMYNQAVIGKVQIPRIDKRNDAALWLFILRKNVRGECIPEVLAQYRVSSNSLSSGSKIKLLWYHYDLYHRLLKYNPVTSIILCVTNSINFFLNKIVYTHKV